MKGILLAGGKGTRLYPVTRAVSKQLLPVYDKPMFYYPLSLLLLAGIDDILIITAPQDMPLFQSLLGDGRGLGVRIRYAPQPQPRGIADALRIAGGFFAGHRLALILGDNLFLGNMRPLLLYATATDGAAVFVCKVPDPENYGVAEVIDGKVVSITEKPKTPASKLAIPGFYFYPPDAVDIAMALSPSPRGELEITDVNREYLKRGRLAASLLPRDITWVDAGTCAGLLRAGNLASKHRRSGGIAGCLEEAARVAGFIDTPAQTTL